MSRDGFKVGDAIELGPIWICVPEVGRDANTRVFPHARGVISDSPHVAYLNDERKWPGYFEITLIDGRRLALDYSQLKKDWKKI